MWKERRGLSVNEGRREGEKEGMITKTNKEGSNN